jgi:hypothetical protein
LGAPLDPDYSHAVTTICATVEADPDESTALAMVHTVANDNTFAWSGL